MLSVYLNIGSNKGDRRDNIDRAAALAAEWVRRASAPHAVLVRTAPIEHSMPVGYASDAEFLNLGVALDIDVNAPESDIDAPALPFEPLDLLHALQAIELEIAPDSPHRNADGTYRDRMVDIDIIHIDGVASATPELTLPHPRAEARAFVMRPMAFLAPDWSPTATVDASKGRRKKSIQDMGRDSVEAFKTKNKPHLVVVLDNIRSLNNIGSIFRTSDAFVVERIVLCGITATPPAPEIHKTALGAEMSVDWTYEPDTLSAVRSLQADGYTVACLEQVHDSVSLEQFQPTPSGRYAIVAGNEVSGVDAAVVSAADVCIEIPQEGTKHSLNVAVSTAIAIWHFYQQMRLK